ncbi:flavin-containing monooxygenase [Spongisporangium articulatum]|uniref:Flavin-containing monooxygenase n=1 Tax=Spongisporangium articulatum TaxID=3362603 RepID=A0ABW8AII3_9ACTN
MSEETLTGSPSPATAVEHVDVLIVGAGLSGVGAAYHLRDKCPGLSLAILEARQAIGGTWDLFRYPGVRSDSDMFTLGYKFRPWASARGIAPGGSILQYVRDTARETGVDQLVRFGHKVVKADWSSAESLWFVTVETDEGEKVISCSFVFGNTGYYRYDEGYSPSFPGVERFGGTVIHPQHWPEGFDYSGKKVVVIGSGATAVTLVPAMADTAASVTMLQRSPSYVLSLPSTDPVAATLGRALPKRWAFPIVRWKSIAIASFIYNVSRKRPELVKRILKKQVAAALPKGFDVEKHFSPTYNPWDQRLCLVPNNDLFKAIRKGKADVVTDTIETFTETGIRLTSGQELEADVVVSATGLNLLPVGGIHAHIDGEPIVMNQHLTYKGTMLSGVPNFAFVIGYTNASWTLKAELVDEYVCRLLKYMQDNDFQTVTPVAPPLTGDEAPLIDFNSGYVLRSIENLPKQGTDAPWRLFQNYPKDVKLFRRAAIDDGVLRFDRVPTGTKLGEGRKVSA